MPNPGFNQVMTAYEFRAALALRLLLPICRYAGQCTAEGCSGFADDMGYHILCCGGAENLRKYRHDIVRDAIFDLSRFVDFTQLKMHQFNVSV